MNDRAGVRDSAPTRLVSRPALGRAVWLLGWVSFATDAASEAIYPLLPFFLTHVLGGTAFSIGVIEGAAEAANSLLRILAGAASDRAVAKRPFVLGGYALSSLVRPLIALTSAWTQVLVIRFVDRVGKGIRSAPRDSWLAGWATPATRGRVFSFHRGMDHAGAVSGPLLAWWFLWIFPGQFRGLFAATIVPGAIAVILLLLVAEPPGDRAQPVDVPRVRWRDLRALWRGPLGRFLLALVVFTLGNSTDAFLLLRLGQSTSDVASIPLLWAALHVVKAGSSFAFGHWSDRFGRRRVIGLGWLIYVSVYVGFAFSTSTTALVAWFLFYGCYFGLVEGAEKALVADLVPVAQRGLAFGIYATVQGLGALAASLLFGAVWTFVGPTVAFLVGAALALAATCGLAISGRRV